MRENIKGLNSYDTDMPFWRKKEKSIKVYMAVDNPDFKMIVAEYRSKPFLLAFGASKRRKTKVEAKASLVGGKAEYDTGKTLEWKFIYNPKNMEGFMPLENALDFMSTAISAVSKQPFVKKKYSTTPLTKETEIDKLIEDVKAEYRIDGLDDLRRELIRWKKHYI